MRTNELFAKKTVFSFEVFPPKPDTPIETIYAALDELSQLHPDFISVTCGASGSGSGGNRTVEVASAIKHTYGCETAAHMPCIYLTEDDALRTLDDLKKAGIENILALRGDETPGRERAHVFEHASDLVAFIKRNAPEFNVIGACYPEGHTEAQTMAADIRNVKTKVDAGASELISQLFFDNDLFYRFRELADAAGITVPITCGIMPFMSKQQVTRMVFMCGASLPSPVIKLLARFEDDPDGLMRAGIDYACDQLVDLAEHGVDGLHVYTMNRPSVARAAMQALRAIGPL